MLVTLTLRAQAFEMYRCDRPLSMGINLTSFAKILKCAGNSDSVKISAPDDGADVADFIFESEDASQTAHFSLKLMDIDSEHMGVPEDTDYSAVINMASGEYRRIVSDLFVIGDTITIDALKQSMTFAVEGDIGSGSMSIQQSEGGEDKNPVTMTVNNPVKMTFSGKYLTLFTKAVPISDTVTLCMEDESPMAVEFAIPEQMGFVRYFLAPKIDNDE